MATILIRNASLFSPDPLGTNDILIINDRIAAIAQNVSVPEWLGPVQEMDGKGLFAVPGFIDAHVRMFTLPEEAVKRGFLLRSLPFRFQSLSARV